MIAARAPDRTAAPLFQTMLMGGFECAAHKLRNGRRLDIAASTGHDLRAREDYGLLRDHGIRGARDGLRWHLIERRPGAYDWSSFLPTLHAARDAGVSVAWDLLHYGVPSGVDVFSARFISRFAAFARAATQVIASETNSAPVFTPVNEISFWAWAGGSTGGLNPFARNRGGALKRQLVLAALEAGAAIRSVEPTARIACAEPLVHIHPKDGSEEAATIAAAHNAFQFEALDMLLGRTAPELGGHEAAVDIIGLNCYFNNQWVDEGPAVHLGDFRFVPLSALIGSVSRRYRQPLYIAETGTEGIFRPYWLRYVCDEICKAAVAGHAVGGICLYPIISHLGWDDDRHCRNGLFDGHDATAPRLAYEPLAREVQEQGARFSDFRQLAAVQTQKARLGSGAGA